MRIEKDFGFIADGVKPGTIEVGRPIDIKVRGI